MKFGSLVTRLLSPAGFVLAGLCLLLPFMTMSCSSKNQDAAVEMGTITFTGADLVVGGAPDLKLATEPSPGTVEAEFLKDAQANPYLDGSPEGMTPQRSAIAAAALVVAGILISFVPWVRTRQIASAIFALAAAALFYDAFLSTRQLWAEQMLPLVSDDPTTLARLIEMIHPRFGMWLVMGLLIVTALINVDGAVRQAFRRES